MGYPWSTCTRATSGAHVLGEWVNPGAHVLLRLVEFREAQFENSFDILDPNSLLGSGMSEEFAIIMKILWHLRNHKDHLLPRSRCVIGIHSYSRVTNVDFVRIAQYYR